MQGFKDLHLVSELDQVPCACQTGRAGADHSDLLPVLHGLILRCDSILSCPVSHKALQLADGHSLALDAADADAFALGLLRADTAADCRKSGALRDHAGSGLEISVLHFLDKRGNIDGNRASLHAAGILAVQAALRFRDSLFLVVSETYFVKILCSYQRFLLTDRHFLHHIHYASPPQFPHPPWCVAPSWTFRKALPSSV